MKLRREEYESLLSRVERLESQVAALHAIYASRTERERAIAERQLQSVMLARIDLDRVFPLTPVDPAA